ncbi:MAG: PD-(D/E)XK nuclease family transposase, partial [Acetatifactor sp.]
TYMSKMFDNLREGDDYDKVKACVHIGILDFALYEYDTGTKMNEFYSDYRILNTKTHQGFTDNFVIKTLMLGNMENASREQKEDYGSVYYWAKLFKAKTWEELRMIAKNNERMESLINTASRLSGDRSVQEACEARIMHRLDINTYEHRIQEKDLTINTYEHRIQEKDLTINTYKHRLQKKEEMIESYEQDMQRKDEIIGTYEQDILKKDEMIDNYEQDILKKDEMIESQNSMLAEKEDELQKLRQRLAQYEG